MKRPKLVKRWNRFLYKRRLQRETCLCNIKEAPEQQQKNSRFLYASPVDKDGKAWLKKIIERFGFDQFDYIIFVYDDVPFDEEIFRKCTIIREKGKHFYFLKKYITQEVCNQYDYIFLWCDDIDVSDFDPNVFIKIMQTNNLQIAQPALTLDSYFTWDITLQDKRYKVGRYVDFVEIMVPVFSPQAWGRFWNMIELDRNYRGWGYDLFARSFCRYTNMGIIDCQPVRHVRPVGQRCTDAKQDKEYITNKYAVYRIAEKISYGKLF